MWCKECQQLVEPIVEFGNLFCPKCKTFLKDCTYTVKLTDFDYKIKGSSIIIEGKLVDIEEEN